MEPTAVLPWRRIWLVAVALVVALTVIGAAPQFVEAKPNSGTKTHAQQKEDFKQECIDGGGVYLEGKTAFDAPYFGCKQGNHHEICVDDWFKEEGRDACYEFTTPSHGKPAAETDVYPALNTNLQAVQEVSDPGAGQPESAFHAERPAVAAAPIIPGRAAGGDTPCHGAGKWCRVVCDTSGLCDWVCTDCIWDESTVEVAVVGAAERQTAEGSESSLTAEEPLHRADPGVITPTTELSEPGGLQVASDGRLLQPVAAADKDAEDA